MWSVAREPATFTARRITTSATTHSTPATTSIPPAPAYRPIAAINSARHWADRSGTGRSYSPVPKGRAFEMLPRARLRYRLGKCWLATFRRPGARSSTRSRGHRSQATGSRWYARAQRAERSPTTGRPRTEVILSRISWQPRSVTAWSTKSRGDWIAIRASAGGFSGATT